jgi:hypothetical protein
MAKKKKSKKDAGISWDPDDAEGGLPDDLDVTLRNPRCRVADKTDYTEDADVDSEDAVPMLSITCEPDEGDEFDIHLSAGNINRIVPSDDGETFVPAEDSRAKGLAKTSNAFLFLASLVAAGFPKKKIAADGIPIIDGTYCHLMRVDQPKRRGLAAAEDEEDSGRPRTVPNITEIHSLPWEKGKKKKSKKTSTKSNKKAKSEDEDEDEDEEEEADEDEEEEEAPARKKKGKAKTSKKSKSRDEDEDEEEEEEEEEESDDEDEDESDDDSDAEKAIKKVLKDPKFKKGVKTDKLYKAVFALVQKAKNRKAILKLVQDSDWIGDDDRPWNYDEDDETLTSA